MRVLESLRRWLRLAERSSADELPLDVIFQRRFSTREQRQFERVWRRLAEILRVSPASLSEDASLKELAQSASVFPYTVLDELADFVTEVTTGVPDHDLETVGQLVDWLLSNSAGDAKGALRDSADGGATDDKIAH